MSRSNADVGTALGLLREGLGSFVEREVQRPASRDRIADFMRSNPQLREKPIREWEVYGLLNLMQYLWGSVFAPTLGPTERGFVNELRGWRNKWAHQEPLSSADVDRALDTAVRLLRAVKAETQAAEVTRLLESHKAGQLARRPDRDAKPPSYVSSRTTPPGSTPVYQADEIRQYAMEHYVAPWRDSGREALAIRAGDIVREMALWQATPNVCSALEGRKFQAQANLVLIRREGPRRSTTTTYHYRQI